MKLFLKLLIERKMKIIDEIKTSDKPLFSFELLPPLKGHNIKSLYTAIDNLIEFKPNNINITCHQEEVVYEKKENGLLQRKYVKKRPGTVAIAAAIKNRYSHLNVVPHLICGGFSRDETEYALIDLNYLEINNLLVVRGDPPNSAKIFKPEPDGHEHALGLIKQIMNMNKGIYNDQKLKSTTETEFCLGVAGYPEKHAEAPNMQTDLQFLQEKVEAGADYIVTQMFFDNKYYFDFVQRCRNIGIDVPIIAGIKPITFLNDVEFLPQTFNINIPVALMKKLEQCSSNKDAFKVGVEWSLAQAQELIENGVPGLHFFTIGISDNVRQVAREIF